MMAFAPVRYEGAGVPAPRGFTTLPYLRAWRAHRQRQQGDVAEHAGVSKATIIRAEAGRPVTVITAVRLARELGLSVKQLQETDPDRLVDPRTDTEPHSGPAALDGGA